MAVVKHLTADTPEETTYHYTFEGSAGEAGLAVVVVCPLDVDASSEPLVPEYIRLDPNFSCEIIVRPLDADVRGATPAAYIVNPSGAVTGFTFALNNNNNADAAFNLSAQIRWSGSR